eukprot:jgi/Bigna1/70194/fgenesh1_pg.11_\
MHLRDRSKILEAKRQSRFMTELAIKALGFEDEEHKEIYKDRRLLAHLTGLPIMTMEGGEDILEHEEKKHRRHNKLNVYGTEDRKSKGGGGEVLHLVRKRWKKRIKRRESQRYKQRQLEKKKKRDKKMEGKRLPEHESQESTISTGNILESRGESSSDTEKKSGESLDENGRRKRITADEKMKVQKVYDQGENEDEGEMMMEEEEEEEEEEEVERTASVMVKANDAKFIDHGKRKRRGQKVDKSDPVALKYRDRYTPRLFTGIGRGGGEKRQQSGLKELEQVMEQIRKYDEEIARLQAEQEEEEEEQQQQQQEQQQGPGAEEGNGAQDEEEGGAQAKQNASPPATAAVEDTEKIAAAVLKKQEEDVLALTFSKREGMERGTQELKAAREAELENWYKMAKERERQGLNEEAVELATRAANGGLTDAQFFLGAFYANGKGTNQDYTQAVKWHDRRYIPCLRRFKLAAAKNSPDAQYYLALCYANGAGVEKDTSTAYELWLQAAENGQTLSQNIKEAIAWYERAAENGNEQAQWRLTDLRSSTPAT